MGNIQDLPKAMCILFGLTYALHLNYPKTLKLTFQFIQQVSLFRPHWPKAEATDFEKSAYNVNRCQVYCEKLLTTFFFFCHTSKTLSDLWGKPFNFCKTSRWTDTRKTQTHTHTTDTFNTHTQKTQTHTTPTHNTDTHTHLHTLTALEVCLRMWLVWKLKLRGVVAEGHYCFSSSSVCTVDIVLIWW